MKWAIVPVSVSKSESDGKDCLEIELINMKFVEELSYKEMAAKTGLSVGNVGYKLHHAIKFLADEMESEGFFYRDTDMSKIQDEIE